MDKVNNIISDYLNRWPGYLIQNPWNPLVTSQKSGAVICKWTNHLPTPWVECKWILILISIKMNKRKNHHYHPACWNCIPCILIVTIIHNSFNINSKVICANVCVYFIVNLPSNSISFRTFLKVTGTMFASRTISLMTCNTP